MRLINEDEDTVVNGSYNAQSQSLILTLVSGQTITIPISDLIAGLQARDAWNSRAHTEHEYRTLLREAEPDNGWISVEDRLPKEYESVLLVAEVTNSFIFSKTDRVITIGRLKPSGKWQTIGMEYLDMEITHWRTLPALPKGE